MSDPRNGPVLIDLEAEPAPNPAAAAPVPEPGPELGSVPAMERAAALASRPPSRLARIFWASASAVVGLLVSVFLWDAVTGLVARSPLLGGAVSVALALAALAALGLVLREAAAWFRLGRLDRLHRAGETALAARDLAAARRVTERLIAFYRPRPELAPGAHRLSERMGDAFDADTLLGMAEHDLLAPLDAAASREVEAAARQVAAVTALVPLAFADVVAALTANLRMIRRIAEVYGGRAGTFGSWRLTRTVLAHLVATGAVAVGDDLIHSVAGGGLVSRISRRFGEGVVNGALTARVGVAAMEVCRPLPFTGAVPKPSVTAMVRRSLTGLFGGEGRG